MMRNPIATSQIAFGFTGARSLPTTITANAPVAMPSATSAGIVAAHEAFRGVDR